MAVDVNNGTSLGEVVIIPLKGEKGDGVTEIQAEIDSIRSELQSELNATGAGVQAEIDVANARIDELIAPSGQAPNPSEIVDARIGASILGGKTYSTLGEAIRGQITELNKGIKGATFSHTFAGKENFDMDYPVQAGKPFYIRSDVDNAGWIYIYGAPSSQLAVRSYYRKFTPTISNSSIRYYSGTGSGYTGTINFSILSEEEYMLRELALKSTGSMIVTGTDLSNLTGGTKSLNDFPYNSIVCVGASNLGLKDYPQKLYSTSGDQQGVCITFDGQGINRDGNGIAQIWITTGGVATRWKAGSWTSWKIANLGLAQYNTREAWLSAYPSDLLGDIYPNKIVCIGSSSIHPLDQPKANFTGNVISLASMNVKDAGMVQLAFDMNTNKIFRRTYYYSSSGNYWGAWSDGEEEYHVGTGQQYTSFTSLLLDLAGNNRQKVIYIHDGEYDMFAEYLAEINAGRLTIPPDDVQPPDYFGTYNAFVPNNTRIVGLGNVTLKMTPTVAQLESMSTDAGKTGYGASRTWSPLNIYGSVEIENITVKGHNCRYCLHNDDHNAFANAKQHYKNVRFQYEKSDVNSAGHLLGYNITIGFGIQAGSTHIFEDCEIYMDTDGHDSAYYGHDGSSSKDGTLILKNCRIYSSNFSNSVVIRLQTLATAQGKVNALFENCYMNGGVRLAMYYASSPQNFDVTFTNCNKLPVSRTIAGGGTIVDPYTVKWFNPLPTPTASNPLIETDSYSA